MTSGVAITVTRWTGGPDFPALLSAYVLATEIELGSAATVVAELPDHYQSYLRAPASYHARDDVLVAYQWERPVGCVLATEPEANVSEVKRLWVEPDGRRLGAGRALLLAAVDAARSRHATTARLGVWRWRTDAIALYRSEGFVEVPSPDGREGLLTMERAL